MAGIFDWMLQGTANPLYSSGPTTTTASSSTPDWYNDYIKGIAGKGMELADRAQNQPVPQQSIAGFTPDQLQAFQQVRNNQGVWQPGMAAAVGLNDQAVGQAAGAAGSANAAVAGPAADFRQNWQSYMSPYTQSVVAEIGRLGQQNFAEKIMPGVTSSMIGSGQFGSERNADVLGRAARDAAANITGQQAAALESGYAQAGTLFNADANRQQQQQQLQANTALAGGQLAAGTSMDASKNRGALTQAQHALGLSDAQQLQAIGQQQQQLNQAGLDTAYNNQVAQNNAGWSQLDNLNSIVRGAQLPTSQTSTNTGALTRTYGASPLQQLGTIYSAAAS